MKTKLELKWETILDILEVKDNNVRKFLAEYAEGHMQIELQYNTVLGYDTDKATLPTSLKILSSLNLKDKNLIIDETLETPIQFHYHIGEFYDLSDLMQEESIENGVRHMLIQHLNKELETKDTFRIGKRLISSIMVIKEDKNQPKVIFFVNFKVE